MRATLIVKSALLALIILSQACSTVETEKPLYVSCNDFMKQSHRTAQVELAAGSTTNLSLCSNASTGFQWSSDAVISDSSVVQQIDHKYLEPTTSSGAGVPGRETWTFKALKPGTATILLEYSRPWEGGQKGEWTYSLSVTVK